MKPETVNCLEFDAVTAWRTFSLGRCAKDEQEASSSEVPTGDEQEVIGIVVRGKRLLSPAERNRSFPPDIRSWVVLLARIAGWQPSIRCPVPGNEGSWRAYLQVQTTARVTQAVRVRQPYPNLRLC